MRITAGEWRDRILKVPEGLAVRPTQDRVRQALFSMLYGNIEGAQILDLFAGSGSVGLEALSRGANHATFVELNPKHISCLQANITSLKAQAKTTVIQSDAYNWLKAVSSKSFDIVFADPPYELGANEGYQNILENLFVNHYVSANSFFIAEMKANQPPDIHNAWEICRDKTYGQTRIVIYRLKE